MGKKKVKKNLAKCLFIILQEADGTVAYHSGFSSY